MATDRSSAWQRLTTWPKLDPGDVHVWRANRDDLAVGSDDLVRVLDREELQRGARFVREVDRRRFTASRYVLRSILGRYLATSPRLLEFSYGTKGKPSLAGETSDLTFNLSHSRSLVLVAVALRRAIGVDVERISESIDVMTIVDRFFSAYEVEELHRRQFDLRHEAFFRGWVRKEAYIKARGEGLSLPLHSFDVTVFPDPPALLRSADDPTGAERWSFHELEPGSGYTGMLVAEGAVERVWCLEADDWLAIERTRNG